MNLFNRLQDNLILKIQTNYKKYLKINVIIFFLVFIPFISYGIYIPNNKLITSLNILDTRGEFFKNFENKYSSKDSLNQDMILNFDKWLRNLKLNYANSDENLRNYFRQLQDKYNIDKIIFTNNNNGNISTYTFFCDTTNGAEFEKEIYDVTTKFNQTIHNILLSESFVNRIKDIYNQHIDFAKINFKRDRKMTASILAVNEEEIDYLIDNNFDKIINYIALGNRVNFNVEKYNDNNFKDYAKFYYEYNNLINISNNHIKMKKLMVEFEYIVEISKKLIIPLNHISRDVDKSTFLFIGLPLTVFFGIFSFLIFILILRSYFTVRYK